MAILPSDPFKLNNVIVQQEPGKTWYIDKVTNRINGNVDGLAAVRQAVEIILRTDRFQWLIYTPSSGVDYRYLVGNDPGYVAMELQRRITEALKMDSRVTGISNYNFVIDGDKLSVSFTVNTIFGSTDESMEVSIV